MRITQSRTLLKELDQANKYLRVAIGNSHNERCAVTKDLRDRGVISEKDYSMLINKNNKSSRDTPSQRYPFEVLSLNEQLQLSYKQGKSIDRQAVEFFSEELLYRSELQNICESIKVSPLVDEPSVGLLLQHNLQSGKEKIETLRLKLAGLARLKMNESEISERHRLLTEELNKVQTEQYQVEKDLSEDRRISVVKRGEALYSAGRSRRALEIAILESKKRASKVEESRIDLTKALVHFERLKDFF